MKKFLLILLVISLVLLLRPRTSSAAGANWWSFRSIDTMKYSRDTAREKLTDEKFKNVIDSQVKAIADTGASHVAIATPYDEEFIPFLTSWVNAARKYHLKIWFRGNLSGWEGWFDYPKIGRAEHLQKIKEFLSKHPDLFQDGDIFSACPECENGGPGDPRQNGDKDGHRQFLIDEYRQISDLFKKQGKDVQTNYNSMNADVARLIMNKETTKALGGVVVIDHYVGSPTKLARDIADIAKESNGKVVLGEFGAPIPDINGKMTPNEQADWISEAMKSLVSSPDLIGMNYWVNTGGSTQLWEESGPPRPAVDVIRSYYAPTTYQIAVKNGWNQPLEGASAFYMNHVFTSNSSGVIGIPYFDEQSSITLSATNYFDKTLNFASKNSNIQVRLEKSQPHWLDWLQNLIYRIFHV